MASSTAFLTILIVSTGLLLNYHVLADYTDNNCPFECVPGSAQDVCQQYELDGPCTYDYKPVCVQLSNGQVRTFPTACTFCTKFKETRAKILHCCECTTDEEATNINNYS